MKRSFSFKESILHKLTDYRFYSIIDFIFCHFTIIGLLLSREIVFYKGLLKYNFSGVLFIVQYFSDSFDVPFLQRTRDGIFNAYYGTDSQQNVECNQNTEKQYYFSIRHSFDGKILKDGKKRKYLDL